MLTYIIAVGALLGAVDCIRGNRYGLGAKFEEGFLCLGATAFGIAGIICVAPVLGNLVKPVLVPLYRLLRIDPAMFASLLANNMGGYPLAAELADDVRIGAFSGLIVASLPISCVNMISVFTMVKDRNGGLVYQCDRVVYGAPGLYEVGIPGSGDAGDCCQTCECLCCCFACLVYGEGLAARAGATCERKVCLTNKAV